MNVGACVHVAQSVQSHNKHDSKNNKNDETLEVEELSDGDMGYGPDIEVRHPDEYEEVGESSGIDSEDSPILFGSEIEEHLSAGIERLYFDAGNGKQLPPISSESGKKRGSKDISRSRDRSVRPVDLATDSGHLEITEIQTEKNSRPSKKSRQVTGRQRGPVKHLKAETYNRSRSLTPVEIAILSEPQIPGSPNSFRLDEDQAMDLG